MRVQKHPLSPLSPSGLVIWQQLLTRRRTSVKPVQTATHGMDSPLCPITSLATAQKPEPILGRSVTNSLTRENTGGQLHSSPRNLQSVSMQTEPARCSELSQGLRLPSGDPVQSAGRRLSYSAVEGTENLKPRERKYRASSILALFLEI